MNNFDYWNVPYLPNWSFYVFMAQVNKSDRNQDQMIDQ